MLLTDKSTPLQQAHILYDVYKRHNDGLLDLRVHSDAKTEIEKLQHFDADVAGMLRQMLTYYNPKPIVQEFQQYKYADPQLIVPRSNDGAMVGVSEIVKQVQTDIGEWASVGSVSRNVGRVDIGTHEIVYGSKYKAASIAYTSQELDRVTYAKSNNSLGLMVDIVATKMGAVQRAYQRFINDAMAFGMPGYVVYGIHTHPNVTRIKAPYRPGALRTPEENIAIFSLAIEIMNIISANLYSPDVCIGPLSIMNELSMQRVGSSSDLSTLEYLKRNSATKAYIPTKEAETASRTKGSILHFMLRDTDTMGLVTKSMTQLAMPQFRNGEWEVVWDSSVSGVHMDRPYKHLILELPE
jgi:Uncharacterized protein conserved in bacteria (DUF2184)